MADDNVAALSAAGARPGPGERERAIEAAQCVVMAASVMGESPKIEALVDAVLSALPSAAASGSHMGESKPAAPAGGDVAAEDGGLASPAHVSPAASEGNEVSDAMIQAAMRARWPDGPAEFPHDEVWGPRIEHTRYWLAAALRARSAPRPGGEGDDTYPNGVKLGPTELIREGREADGDVMQVAREMLESFTHEGHPGRPCLQSGWIGVETVARWREALRAAERGAASDR